MYKPSQEQFEAIMAKAGSDPFEQNSLVLGKAVDHLVDKTPFNDRGHFVICNNHAGQITAHLLIDGNLIASRSNTHIELHDPNALGGGYIPEANFVLQREFNFPEIVAGKIPLIPERNYENWEKVLKLAKQEFNGERVMSVITATPGTYEHFLEVLPPLSFGADAVLCSEPSFHDPRSGKAVYVAVYVNDRGTEFLQYATLHAFKNFGRHWLPRF